MHDPWIDGVLADLRRRLDFAKRVQSELGRRPMKKGEVVGIRKQSILDESMKEAIHEQGATAVLAAAGGEPYMTTLPPPPTQVDEHTSWHLWQNIRVRDRDTGEVICFVQSADMETGKLTRYDARPIGDTWHYDFPKNEYGEPLILHETRNLSIEWAEPDGRWLDDPRYQAKIASHELGLLHRLIDFARGTYGVNPLTEDRFKDIDIYQLLLKLAYLAERTFFEEYAAQAGRSSTREPRQH